MKSRESDAVSEVEHRHGNSDASLKCAQVNMLIIYITMHKQEALTYKALRHSNRRLTDIRKKPVEFFMVSHRRRPQLSQ